VPTAKDSRWAPDMPGWPRVLLVGVWRLAREAPGVWAGMRDGAARARPRPRLPAVPDRVRGEIHVGRIDAFETQARPRVCAWVGRSDRLRTVRAGLAFQFAQG
jgi:hypothetical protein